jgi:hypothetical protein
MRSRYLLASSLFVCLVSACSAPSDRNPPSSGNDTIPETVTPSCASTANGEKECTCPAGYELDGNICRFINHCVQVQNGGCSSDAVCTAKVGGRTCQCKSGFIGDGETCTSTDGGCGTCDPNATCQTSGSTKSCVCNNGYTGNGTTCVPVNDPCAANNGGCSPDADCLPTATNTVQCTCKSGYEGNGVTCTLVDLCLVNNGGCDVNATCLATSASTVQCSCKPGFEGNGVTCTEIDPCSLNNGGCEMNASCAPGANGQATCACKSGYFGDGYTCTKIAGSIGSVCTDSSTHSQSTCQRGLSCYDMTTANYCSAACTQDADCGSFGQYKNLCLDLDGSRCVRGCDPADRTTCGRADLACYERQDANGHNVGACLPACSSDEDCTYGDRCNASTGVCESQPCGANDTCPGAGDACYVRTGDSAQTLKSCVSQCTISGCSAGLQCNTTTKVCDPVVHSTYESCGASVALCHASDMCVPFGAPTSLCMHFCTTDTDCPSGSTCAVSLENNQKVCAFTCGTPQSPNESACPSGTSCAWFADSSKTTLFCGPPP